MQQDNDIPEWMSKEFEQADIHFVNISRAKGSDTFAREEKTKAAMRLSAGPAIAIVPLRSERSNPR